jgi:hypothetical protein
LELAKQHGRALANAVETALEVRITQPVNGPLRLAVDDVELTFQTPDETKLKEELATGNQYEKRRAERLLAELKEHGTIQTDYAFPIQAAQVGEDLTLIAIPGEVVVDYSIRLKKELAGPSRLWVAGYSNHVFGYLPSLRVLKEGGYEGGGAMVLSAYPGPFAESVEERVIGKALELVRNVRATIPR